MQAPPPPASQDFVAEHLHEPSAHTNPAGQACPQAPQLAESVKRSRHPLPQQMYPLGQAAAPLQLHAAPEHVSPCAHWLPAHTHTGGPVAVPASQLPPSPQSCSEPQPHRPALHALSAPHEFPQPPQLAGSSVVESSQPLSTSGDAGCEQSPKPSSQNGTHRLFEQPREDVLSLEQPRPHLPQLYGSALVLLSQPSEDVPLQFA